MRDKNGKGTAPKIGVIGGSGLYEMDGARKLAELSVKTPFGEPSDKIALVEVEGVPVAFLPRHGRGHRFLPGEINQRANLWALKSLGVEQVLGFSAVGSLREQLPPRTFVFPDQLVDETRGRPSTFFGEGIVAHVSFARPFCSELGGLLFDAAKKIGLPSVRGGVSCVMEGPQFSTKAESEKHRAQGYDLIGMTASPEAKLAREAELCYAPVSMVTDFDCWKPEDEVSTSKVIEHLMSNVGSAKKLLSAAVGAVASRRRDCECAHALRGNIFTAPQAIPPAAKKKLDLLIGRYVAVKK
jgi:5'-methylthioadenosine phosphorylase